jgi:thiamine kinase-like enzyme
MFLMTYLPYGILSLIHGQESIIKESSITLLSIMFVLLANLFSPIIFAYRNKRVRRGVRRLLGVDKKTNERLEKLNSLKRSCSTRIKNYRQNNLHKSFNLGNIKGTVGGGGGGIKASNMRRTQSFMTCNYLTPPDAAAKCGVHLSPIHHHSPSHFQQQQQQQNVKEKKSILKIVADSSRKFRCQFTNCQTGLNQDTTAVNIPTEV